MQVWSKSIVWFRRYSIGKTNFTIFHGLVALKIGSRLPKSNQQNISVQVCLFFFGSEYRIGNRNCNIFQVLVTLKLGQGHQNIINSRSPPIDVSIHKFGQTTAICSDDIAPEKLISTFLMGW